MKKNFLLTIGILLAISFYSGCTKENKDIIVVQKEIVCEYTDPING